MAVFMVVGSWDEVDKKLQDTAVQLGKTLAERNHVVVTGGDEGIPYYVNVGVNSANGINIAFLNEGKEVDRGALHYKVVKYNIPTEMGWDGRSVLAVKSSDYLIVLGGSNGTLNEITLAYLHSIPIFILEDSSELIRRFKTFLYNGKYIDVRKNVEIKFYNTLEEILALSCLQ